MKVLDQVLAKISEIAAWISGMAVVAMLFLIMLDVILKYTISLPIVGTLEIVSYYFMPMAVFLAFMHVEQTKHHITVPIFTDMLPFKVKFYLNIVVAIFSAGILLFAAWAALQKAISVTATNQSVGLIYYSLPIWPARWLVPFVYSGMALQILISALRSSDEGSAS